MKGTVYKKRNRAGQSTWARSLEEIEASIEEVSGKIRKEGNEGLRL